MTTAAVIAIPAPKCPSWCTEQHETDGWDVVGLNTTKFCRCAVPIDADADVCLVTIERYASCHEGRIQTEQVDVRVEILGEFGPGGLDALADGLRHARDVAGW